MAVDKPLPNPIVTTTAKTKATITISQPMPKQASPPRSTKSHAQTSISPPSAPQPEESSPPDSPVNFQLVDEPESYITTLPVSSSEVGNDENHIPFVIPYDPPAYNYYKKRLSTIPERSSRASSIRLSTVSQSSFTSGRTRTKSGSQSVHSRAGSTSASISSSTVGTPSLRLRRRQRQILRTPSVIRDFSDNEVLSHLPTMTSSSYNSALPSSTEEVSGLHRGPSTSSNSSSESSSSQLSLSHSRDPDTPPTTAEALDDDDEFDETGLEAVAASAAAKRRMIKGRRRDCTLIAGKDYNIDEEERCESPDDWRMTWYTARTHFSDA